MGVFWEEVTPSGSWCDDRRCPATTGDFLQSKDGHYLASNGKSPLAANHQPDLVLMDVKMPVMDEV